MVAAPRTFAERGKSRARSALTVPLSTDKGISLWDAARPFGRAIFVGRE